MGGMDDSSLFAAAGNINDMGQVGLGIALVPLVLYSVIAIAVWCCLFWRKVTVFSLFILVAIVAVAALYVRMLLLWFGTTP
jgi:hypothetical protein